MKIRNIELPQDEEQVLLGMRDFISRMDYTEFLPEDDQELLNSLNRMLSLDCVSVYVVEDGSSIVGGIGMVYAPSLWDFNAINAEELFWWSSPTAPPTATLRLLRHVVVEAKKKGCKLFTFKALTTSPASIDKVYRRMGLVPIETAYMGVC